MILCAGECLIDMLPRDVNEHAMLEPVAGGAVMNTAVGLGRLGVPVEFFSGLSTDQFGRLIQAHLTASHVGLEYGIRSDRPTTLAFVEFNEGVVSYDFYDENTAGRMIETGDLPKLPETCGAVFCGGISLINTPAADTYAALVAQNDDRLVMLDPNIRPKFIRDPAGYRKRIERLIAQADIVKTSDEDLEWLFPEADSVESGIQQLLTLGARIVLFTEGAKGATAWRKDQAPVFVKSKSVEVIDTVGAGDTFNAGILAALYDRNLLSKAAVAAITDEDLEYALGFAATCAAHSVTKVGAQPPWRHELGA